MVKRELILKLAKVVIAVAWTDGQISNEEVNSLKDLLFSMRRSGFDEVNQFNAREWAQLEMYLESPVDTMERDRLVADLQDALRTQGDKEMAKAALQRMAEADDIITDDEKDVLEQIGAAIEAVEVGMVGGLKRVLDIAIQRRSTAVAHAPNREDYFDDFIKNKVYYRVNQQLEKDQKRLAISDQELKKLGLIGGLMAKIAHLDRVVTADEIEGIINIIQESWGLSVEEASFVAEVAVSAVDVTYDTFRMMRQIATTTSVEERRQVLTTLFAVAASDGDMAQEEVEEIRLIARGLDLTHRDFIDAKLEVLGLNRPGAA